MSGKRQIRQYNTFVEYQTGRLHGGVLQCFYLFSCFFLLIHGLYFNIVVFCSPPAPILSLLLCVLSISCGYILLGSPSYIPLSETREYPFKDIYYVPFIVGYMLPTQLHRLQQLWLQQNAMIPVIKSLVSHQQRRVLLLLVSHTHTRTRKQSLVRLSAQDYCF